MQHYLDPEMVREDITISLGDTVEILIVEHEQYKAFAYLKTITTKTFSNVVSGNPRGLYPQWYKRAQYIYTRSSENPTKMVRWK